MNLIRIKDYFGEIRDVELLGDNSVISAASIKRLDDESERCYQQMKNWVETKKWDNGSDIDPVSYERIVSNYNTLYK